MGLKNDLKRMMVERLRLRMAPEQIDDDTPLVGEGLGLDSIDMIELSVAVEKLYGVEIRDEADGRAAFASVAALARFIEERRSAA